MRLIVIGFGNIGRGLARVLLRKDKFLRSIHGISYRVVAVVDEYGAAVDERGLDLKKLLHTAEKTGSVASFPKKGERGKSAIDVMPT